MSVFYVHDITKRIVTPLDRQFYVRGIPTAEAISEITPVHDEVSPPFDGQNSEHAINPTLSEKRRRAISAYQENETLPGDGLFSSLRVSDIMSKDVVTLKQDRSVQNLWDLMQAKQISHVVITAEDGFLTGFVSQHDLANYLMTNDTGAAKLAPVSGLCQHPLVSTSADTFVDSLVNYFVEHRVEGLPATSNGTLVGVITMKDILKQVLTNTANASA